MRKSLLVLAAVVALTVPQLAFAQGGFGQLFEKSAPPVPSQPANQESDVARLLREGGFTIKEAYDDGSVFLEIERGGLTFPVAVGMTGNRKSMWVDIALHKVPGNASGHMDKILNLLELSGSRGTAFFSYRKQYRMIHLIDAIDARLINVANVKKMVDGTLDIALQTEESWNTENWTQARHIGSWSAPLNDGSLEIALLADGSFSLNNRGNGSTVTIQGTYQLEGSSLSMDDGQGTKIVAQLRFVDGNHFELTLNGENLRFERV